MKKFLLLTIFILLLPLGIRFATGDPLLHSTQSYESLLTHTLYSMIFKALSFLGDTRVFISVALGLITAALLFILCSELRHYRVLLVLNPIFISIFTTLNVYTIALPLLLLSIKKPRLLVVLTPITALFSPFFALIMLCFLAVHERKHLVYVVPLSIVSSLMANWPRIFFSIPVAEFGDAFGISLLILVLGVGDFVLHWKTQKGALFIFLLLCAPFYSPALVALSLLSSWYAAHFVRALVNRTWLLGEAKTIIPWLAGCLFLFLLISHTMVLATAPPNQGLVSSLESVEGVVLAPKELRSIIAHFGATPFDCQDPCDEILTLYDTWQFDRATQILNQNSIRYILLTDEMRSGGVWNRDDEGFLLLLHHSNYFTLLFNADGYQLWRYEQISTLAK